MKTEHLVIGGGLLALGWFLFNKQTPQSAGSVLPSRQIAPNFGVLAPGQSARMTPMSAGPLQSLLPGGSGLMSGDFSYLPNVGPINADLIAAALDANTITDLPSTIVNPALDPSVLDVADDGSAMFNGDVLPSYTIVDPGWSGLI